jgi:hypothetical protein
MKFPVCHATTPLNITRSCTHEHKFGELQCHQNCETTELYEQRAAASEPRDVMEASGSDLCSNLVAAPRDGGTSLVTVRSGAEQEGGGDGEEAEEGDPRVHFCSGQDTGAAGSSSALPPMEGRV